MRSFLPWRLAGPLLVSVVLGLGLAGCAAGTQTQADSPPQAGERSGTSTPGLFSEGAPEGAGDQSTAEPVPESPAVRLEMAATDPDQVELAAGQPQLVEFFAFW